MTDRPAKKMDRPGGGGGAEGVRQAAGVRARLEELDERIRSESDKMNRAPNLVLYPACSTSIMFNIYIYREREREREIDREIDR